MRWIQSIEIEHFRSIYRLRVDDLSDVNVFSGLNDVGKSNVIKALNVFFNTQVDWQTDLDFQRDTNSFHASKPRNWKTRKLIAIKLTFERPKNRFRSLPNTFWVKRQWDKDFLTQPRESFGDQQGAITDRRKKSSITKFLKRCKFFYVPAIRGQAYFRHLIENLATTLADRPSPDLVEASSQVEEAISIRSAELISNLQRITNLDFELQLPSSMRALLEAATFHTQGNIPLYLRGDGIQSMTVPVILSYLSKESRQDFYFWALEEPENSLEYIKATELADQLYGEYSHDAQIFMSSHSPAFLAMQNSRTSIYRVHKVQERYESTGYEEATTKIQMVPAQGSEEDYGLLPEELGFYKMARVYDSEMRKVIRERDDEIAHLTAENRLLTEPTVLVEGKTDKAIFEEAWARICPGGMPFRVVDVGGASKLTNHALTWPETNENSMCAVFDNDDAGIKAIDGARKCRQFRVRDESRGLCKQYIIGETVKCFTLPVPAFYNRILHARNRNLEIEWYFSDSILLEIDAAAHEGLFCKNSYVEVQGNARKTLTVGEDSLALLVKEKKIALEHRTLTKEGKEQFARCMTHFEDHEFLNFRDVFCRILRHFDPHADLTVRVHLRDLLPM